MMFEKKLVLDTCALLWLAGGNRKLTKHMREAVEHASLVLVSAVSAWEISLKYGRKELLLPLEAQQWFEAVIQKHALVLAPLDVPVLCAANRLPPHHRDPADRFIIATALQENAAVVTADPNFSKYDVRIIA